jgi:hypothetical protein
MVQSSIQIKNYHVFICIMEENVCTVINILHKI